MVNELFKDALTGYDNLFSLIDSNLLSISGDYGTVLYVDLKKLTEVNRDLGSDVGDFYIKKTAQIIICAIEDCCLGLSYVTYRVGGDEFIIIFANCRDVRIYDLADSINVSVAKIMRTKDFVNAGIRYSYWDYTERIPSITYLLKKFNMLKDTDVYDNAYVDPYRVDNIIDRMFNRVKETLKLLRETNELALRDEISQLPNHRAAKITFEKAINEFNVSSNTFSLLFIDGDNLKRYNDTGYENGNNMIKSLGDLISKSTRKDDMLFRWLSGDEFIVLLKNTNKETAYILAERIRANVEQSTQGWLFPITISVGVSNIPQDAIDLSDVIRIAEKANNAAKKLGKNRVV